jgi:cytochrome P450
MQDAVGGKSTVMQEFSYDPFDPDVMANPLPYYRVLRDEYPIYYIEKWDTFALSRFADVWRVLEINDGTFVASEGTLPAAGVLEQHNDGPVPDPPLHPMPFHANFDSPLYEDVRRCTSAPLRPRSVSKLADRIRTLANERLDALLPLGTFDLTQDYGGIVAASIVCELVGLPADLAPDVLATVNAGSLAKPGAGVEVGNARPGFLSYLTPVVEDRRADGADGAQPIVDALLNYRLPD